MCVCVCVCVCVRLSVIRGTYSRVQDGFCRYDSMDHIDSKRLCLTCHGLDVGSKMDVILVVGFGVINRNNMILE